MLADNKSNEIFDDNKISVIILCCDVGQDYGVTLKSLERCRDKVAECIIADAAGRKSYECSGIEEKLFYEAGQQLKVIYCNLAENVYQNVAQLKNHAITLAHTDKVLMVNAGDEVCLKGDGCDLWSFGCRNFEEQNSISDNGRIIFKRLIISGRNILRHIIVNRHTLDVVGGWNPKLDCGEDYELALRICDYGLDGRGFGFMADGSCDFDVFAGSCDFDFLHMADFCGIVFNDECSYVPIFQEDYYTYAYVIAKYVGKLKEWGIFDEVFLNRYNEAAEYGIEEYFTKCQENFMYKGELFNSVDEATQSVLVFMEKSACNGALYHIAGAFAKALRLQGQNVYVYTLEEDEAKRNTDEIKNIAEARYYKAAVEFQAGIFTAQLPSGELMGNILKCPKFMYEFDHPLYISWHLMLPIKEYYVLSQDETYVEYLRKYFPNVKGAWHMPLAGEQVKNANKTLEKQYPLTFVAAYNNYRNCLPAIRNMTGDERRIACRLLQILKNNPNLTAEAALKSVQIEFYEDCVSLDDKRGFVALLHKMREVVHAVTFYYREKIVRILVESGIEIHVFSDTWRGCPFADSDKLVIHHDVPYEKGLEIIAESRVTLNIMSWHKGGMTERVANAMLNKAVCVTDKTSYIERNFCDGEDIVMFDLENIEVLPDRIKELISANGTAKCQDIAEAAYEKAMSSHRWEDRAKAFKQILSQIN